MSILKVARMGHPVLRTPTEPLERGDIRNPVVQRLIDDMMDTMVEYHGVGLAAPQVHESLRLFVIAFDPTQPEPGEDDDIEPFAIVNPEITPVGDEMVEDWEGCLSIPDIRGRVPRLKALALRAQNRRGERIELQLQNFKARVIQHETDHLDGVLFFDRMTSLNSLAFLDEYSRYWVKDRD
jgi:peptide deformylase